MGLRSTVKAVVERALVSSGAAAVARTRLSGSRLVLAYHNIVPDDAPPLGDRANHLPLSAFSAQLDILKAHFEVVPISDVLEHPVPASRPRVAITFDDGYAGAVRYGVQELARRGLPGTIFVVPGLVGAPSFWWDGLSTPGSSGLDPRIRSVALTKLKGEHASIQAWAHREGLPSTSVPEVYRAASEEELQGAAAVPGVTVGSHTWSHPNLASLDPEDIEMELVRSLNWLRQRFRSFLPWVAYPYGCYDDRVTRIAASLDYAGGLGITGGWFSNEMTDPFSVPRLNIPRGLSLAGFQLRMSGIRA